MTDTGNTKVRAIALAGGGPAAGLHIGALSALHEAGIKFDVYALSCIGAWVGIVYNTKINSKDPAQETLKFFDDNVFRDDSSYEWFPVNKAFAPNVAKVTQAWTEFPLSRLDKLGTLAIPPDIALGLWNSARFLLDPIRWKNPADFNNWMLNEVLAKSPMSRYLTSMLYLSKINGLSRIYYKDSPFLKKIDFAQLSKKDTPDIYHNAWRMPRDGESGRGEMKIFHNHSTRKNLKSRHYKPISDMSLCACSALPYIEESVEIDGDDYTEGALIDTVNFKDLLRDKPDLDEIWVSRIVDQAQVKRARNLGDSLANLPMQFAAEVGENDIKLFRQHLLKARGPRVVEIPIDPNTAVDFKWTHSNLMRGFEEGKIAVRQLLKSDSTLKSSTRN